MRSGRSRRALRLVDHAAVSGAGDLTHAALERRIQGLESAGPGGGSASSIEFAYAGLPVIETAATPPYLVRSQWRITAAQAVMTTGPTGAAVTCRIRRGTTVLATLTVPAAQTQSEVVTLTSAPPLEPGDVLHMDITGVPTGAQGPPGRNLTVHLW